MNENTFIARKIRALHKDQSGAIFILLLAGFLILFMVGLSLTDTIIATQDKMAVQVSADTASYSHAVIKARTMNTIVYANIVKRMYYSYAAVYYNGWTAVVAIGIAEGIICAVSLGSKCDGLIEVAVLAVVEGIEAAATSNPTLGALYSEIKGIEKYQEYMTSIVQWWAYIEGIIRGSNNGAMVTTSWPPPPTIADEIKTAVVLIAGFFGANSILPRVSLHTDGLPVTRRPDNDNYCSEHRGSWEHAILAIQSVLFSDSDVGTIPYSFNLLVGIANVANLGCLGADAEFGPEYLDWRITDELTANKNKWAQSTSNISIAYRPHAGRNTTDREKYDYLSSDNTKSARYENEGYFAFSRSEVVYAPTFSEESLNFAGPGVGSLLSGIVGNSETPDMWSPRWKAKNRPFLVPGETLMSAFDDAPANLSTVVDDSVPLLVLSGLVAGLLGGDGFDIQSGGNDLLYLIHTGGTAGVGGFTEQNLQGVPK